MSCSLCLNKPAYPRSLRRGELNGARRASVAVRSVAETQKTVAAYTHYGTNTFSLEVSICILLIVSVSFTAIAHYLGIFALRVSHLAAHLHQDPWLCHSEFPGYTERPSA